MTTYYVRRDGKDSNTGLGDSPDQAWHCLEFAAASLADNDTLIVQPGTWRMSHKLSGSDGTWTTATRYAGTGLDPAAVTPGDYLYAYAATTGLYRSYRIAAAGTGYVDLEEPAAGPGTPANGTFWVSAPEDLPRRTVALTGPAGWVTILFADADLDGNGLAAAILGLQAIRCAVHGGRFHGTTGAGNGIVVNSAVIAHLHDVETHDCYRGIYLDYRTAVSSLVGCRSHHNRDTGICAYCSYTGYYVGHLFGCRADHNAGDGFYLANAVLDGCLAADNAGIGYNAATGNHTFLRCLATGNATGARILSTARLFNNVFHNNTICDLDTADTTTRLLAQNNCIGTVTGTTLDDSNLRDDPCFLDPANDDFRFRGRSPCWNAGYAPPFLTGNVAHIGPHGTRYHTNPPRPAVYARPNGII